MNNHNDCDAIIMCKAVKELCNRLNCKDPHSEKNVIDLFLKESRLVYEDLKDLLVMLQHIFVH